MTVDALNSAPIQDIVHPLSTPKARYGWDWKAHGSRSTGAAGFVPPLFYQGTLSQS